MHLFWWVISRISRTQDFLAGGDFGGVFEVQHDPVIEDVNRVHEPHFDLRVIGSASVRLAL